MAAKYPQIKVTAAPSDTALTLLKKAQDAFYKARAAGAQFEDDPREVAMQLFGVNLQTLDPKLRARYKAHGIPASVYAPGGEAYSVVTFKAALSEWITVEEAA